MENEKTETISEIVSEMRNGPCCWLTPEGIPQHSHDNDLFYKFAERVEAAWKRELYEMEKERFQHVALEFENARLRAALKPVLDIVMDSATSDLSMEMAIMESKRIYNGSGEGEEKK